MLSYSESQIRDMIAVILQSDSFDIVSVGNHHLNRHLVYKITRSNDKALIFKLYYKERRRSREIASLKLLAGSEVKVPKIFDYGSLDDGTEWLITEYIEGELFDKVIEYASVPVKTKLFLEMGEELGKMHAFATFDFLGEWDEEGNCITRIDNYHDHFVRSMESAVLEICSQALPDSEIFAEALEETRKYYHMFHINPVPRLIHYDFDGRNILVQKTSEGFSISGVIDFEGCSPGNSESNFISLYFRYFLEDKAAEDAFWKGYNKYLTAAEDFRGRLKAYLLRFAVSNCSWAYFQAPDYYAQNIDFLRKVLRANKQVV